MTGDLSTWTLARAWEWYNAQPWRCGLNYVPSNAISYTEMWMGYSFDATLIDAELALAQDIGFNCVRVVLPFVVWEHEQEAFEQRFETFLGICDSRGLVVMPSLFDDCAFGPITDPVFGRQPDVLPGWYANGWTPSPGHGMVRDASTWPRLEKYVKQIVSRWKDDPRVWVWDLYNEPTNGGVGEVSLSLMDQAFVWARQVNPTQPLTAGQWNDDDNCSRRIVSQSDIVTLHDYHRPDGLAERIAVLKRGDRPIICTEWFARGSGSTVRDCLPVFRREGVGCMHWGLVNGRTQTHLNWGHRPGEAEPPVWQHDLFHSGHTPYDLGELELFRATIQDCAQRGRHSHQGGCRRERP